MSQESTQGQVADAGQSAQSSQAEGSNQSYQEGSAQQQGQGEFQGQQQQQQERQNPNFEALARREREFLQREARWKEELKAKQEIERKLREYEESDRMFELDPMSILGKKGWTVEKLAEHISSTHEPIAGQEKHKLYGKIKELEERLAKQDEEFKLRDQRQEETQRNSVKGRLMNDLKNLAESNPDKYELVKSENAYDHVFEVLNSYYEKHNTPLPFEDAMDHVEKYLEQQYSKGLQYKKIKSKFGGSFENGDSQEPSYQQETFEQPPRTLSSNFSQTTPPQSNRPLTREESIRRAAALIRFDD